MEKFTLSVKFSASQIEADWIIDGKAIRTEIYIVELVFMWIYNDA